MLDQVRAVARQPATAAQSFDAWPGARRLQGGASASGLEPKMNLAGTWPRLAAHPPAPALSPRARQNRTPTRTAGTRQPRCRARSFDLLLLPVANGARQPVRLLAQR